MFPLSEDVVQATSFQISDLFDDVVKSLTDAQKSMDVDAVQQREAYLFGPQGSLGIPPLWFHFRSVRLDLEVRAITVGQRLGCQLINPVTSGLVEPDSMTRSRISILIEPITRLSDGAIGENNAG